MSYKPVNVNELLSDDSLTAVHAFVQKKVKELHPVPEQIAEKWVLTVVAAWTTPSMWTDISLNQRKMEVIFKLWKDRFFGFGLELIPEKAILLLFRQLAKQEIDKFNTKVAASRQKHKEKYETAYSDDDQVDYFCSHMAKYYNIRTMKKNVAPPMNSQEKKKRTSTEVIWNPYDKKRRKEGGHQKNRKSPPRVSLETTQRKSDFVLECTLNSTTDEKQNAGCKTYVQNLTQDWTLPMPDSLDEEEENENPN